MATVNKRVLKDIVEGKKNLQDEFGIYIAPEENDFYRVHFILPGPEDTPYEGGLYHGMIRLNPDHPKKPPNIHMITPSGRFVAEPHPISSKSRGICTTTSAFHPEAWTPMMNIETIIKGFVSHMCDGNDIGHGGLKTDIPSTKKFTKNSMDHVKSEEIVAELFPELHKSLVNGTYHPPKMGELNKKSDHIKKIERNKKKLDKEENSDESDEEEIKKPSKEETKKTSKKKHNKKNDENIEREKHEKKKSKKKYIESDSSSDDSEEYESDHETRLSKKKKSHQK